jgi:deoxyadenosine/deoxycytidine kinase
MKYRYITIEGNIGAGKTTLANLLSQEYGGTIILEQFRENPYLAKFYEDPQRYAFQLEMSFMLQRYQQLNQVLSEPQIFEQFVVSDYMFTKSLLFAKINLSREEHQLFRHLFDLIWKKLPQPDVIFYLHADAQHLLNNIKKRGRPYEQGITKHYLNKIEKIYFEFFKQMPEQKIAVIDVNDMDWVGNVFVYEHMLDLFDKDYKPGINVVEMSKRDFYNSGIQLELDEIPGDTPGKSAEA